MPAMDFIRNAGTADRNRGVSGRSDAGAMTIDLKRGKLVRVRNGAGNTVTARSGSVWITEQGSMRDVILPAGSSFTLRLSYDA